MWNPGGGHNVCRAQPGTFAVMRTKFLTGPQAPQFAGLAIWGNCLVSGEAAEMPRWLSRRNFRFLAARRSLRAVPCPPVVFSGRSRAARSPFGVMSRWLSWGNFWSPPGYTVTFVCCTAFAAWGNFLSLGSSRSPLWRLGLPACGKFLLGGTTCRICGALVPSYLCSAKLAYWGTLVSGVGLRPG